MGNWRDNFAKRLKKARLKKGVSQKELAIPLGLSDKSISAYEMGRVLPPTDLLPKISELLGVKISYLFGESLEKIEMSNELDYIKQTQKDLSKSINKLRRYVKRAKRRKTKPNTKG